MPLLYLFCGLAIIYANGVHYTTTTVAGTFKKELGFELLIEPDLNILWHHIKDFPVIVITK